MRYDNSEEKVIIQVQCDAEETRSVTQRGEESVVFLWSYSTTLLNINV